MCIASVCADAETVMVDVSQIEKEMKGRKYMFVRIWTGRLRQKKHARKLK
jgi:hypothetical protein